MLQQLLLQSQLQYNEGCCRPDFEKTQALCHLTCCSGRGMLLTVSMEYDSGWVLLAQASVQAS